MAAESGFKRSVTKQTETQHPGFANSASKCERKLANEGATSAEPRSNSTTRLGLDFCSSCAALTQLRCVRRAFSLDSEPK